MKNITKIFSIIPCKIIKRINKFVVKVKLKNKLIFASLNNTGRLEQLLIKNKIGYLTPIKTPHKTKFRLSFIKENKNSAIIIDTYLQMKCFEIALKKNLISWLKEAKILKRNVKIHSQTDINLNKKYIKSNLGISLIDYLIKHRGRKYYLEIKSAVMKENNFALYPDCPSLRGQKHIKELINNNQNSIILFIAGMKNVNGFKPNKNADTKIYELLKIAKNKGVKIKAIKIYLNLKNENIVLEDDNLKVNLQ